MNLGGDINEFRTTWNNECFLKNKSTIVAARKLIRKSIVIDQIRSCRQLRSMEKELKNDLENLQKERDFLKESLANNLQQRLKTLEKSIQNQNHQIEVQIQQEKAYWKQLEQILAKRVNPHQFSSEVVANATYIKHVDKNKENLPPMESKSPVKIPKIRSKKKSQA